MTSRLLGWPLISCSFGLVLGLIIGQAALSVYEVSMLTGPVGPAIGGIIGILVGLYLEFT